MLVTTDNFSGVMDRVSKCRDYVVDLETTGLRLWHGDRLAGVALGLPESDGIDDAYYFPYRHGSGPNLAPERLRPVLDLILEADVLGGHNLVRYDLPMIAMEDDRYLAFLRSDTPRKWDTMIEADLANENEESFKLKRLADKYLGAGASREEQTLLAKLKAAFPHLAPRDLKGSLWRLPATDIEPYACDDVRLPRQLHAIYTPNLARWSMTTLCQEHTNYARLLARMQDRGMRLDPDLIQHRLTLIGPERDRLLAEIRTATDNASFNPNSPKHVPRFFGTPDAQAETILATGHPIAQMVVDWKRLGKIGTTYYEAMLALMDAAGIIHPQLNATRDAFDRGGTRTSRLSCSRPNFQNLPKRAATRGELFQIRECVLARAGHRLLPHDLDGAERWLAGHYTKDPALADAYHHDRDLYAEIADPLGLDRFAGKTAFLSIQYGIGVALLAKRLGITESHAKRVRDQFRRLLPGVQRAMWDTADEAEAYGAVRLWTGLVRHFDGKRARFYTGWNTKIQGGVAEQIRRAMQALEAPLDDLGAQLVLQVHDEIVPEAPTCHVQAVVQRTTEIMTDFDFWLPPRVEATVGTDFHNVVPYSEAA